MNPTIAVVGDSYVWRLKRYLNQANLQNLDLSPNQCSYFGRGGASVWGHKPVTELLDQAVQIPTLSVLYLNIGSNDLCDSNCSGDTVSSQLAWDIYSLARQVVRSSSVQIIIIGQIHPRLEQPHSSYNSWVKQTNDQLYQLCSDIDSPIQYNYVKGLQTVNPNNYVDGIHFTPAGNYKLYRGVRGAVSRALVSCFH